MSQFGPSDNPKFILWLSGQSQEAAQDGAGCAEQCCRCCASLCWGQAGVCPGTQRHIRTRQSSRARTEPRLKKKINTKYSLFGPWETERPIPLSPPSPPPQLSKGTETFCGLPVVSPGPGGRQPQHHPRPPHQSSLCEVTQLCV